MQQASIRIEKEKIILNQELVLLLELNGSSSIEIHPMDEDLYIAQSKGLYSIQLKPLNECELYFESQGFHKLLCELNNTNELTITEEDSFDINNSRKAYKIV